MNGAATVYPRHRPNVCKCGHDFREHTLSSFGTIVINNNTCSQCLTSIATTPNRHYYSGRMENPTSSFVAIPNFLDNRPYPYYCTGSYNGIIRTVTPTGSSGNVVTLPSSATSQIKIGMLLTAIYANPANNTPYRIITVNPTTVVLAQIPNVNIASNSIILITGSFGSTMGPALTANNQRGG